MNDSKQLVRLVIADDHPIVLEGIARILEAENDFQVCAKCSNGMEALQAIRRHQPNVAVLDIVMPDISGLDTLATISAEGLGTKVIFLTAHATDSHILSLIERGARALLLKDTAIGDLRSCIRRVAAGEFYFPNDIVSAAIERETGRRLVGEQFERALSAREREVALLVAEGFSNKDVARRLNLSEGTVRIHVHNIYQKTGVGSRAALTALTLTHRDLLRS